MNIKKILFFVFVLFVCACSHQKYNVSIKGKVQNLQGNVLFFEKGEKIDTIKVDENGNFEWNASVSNPEFLRIKIPGNDKKILLLIDSLERINITFNARWADSGMVVLGSNGTAKLLELNKHHIKILNHIFKINTNFEIQKFENKSAEDAYRKKTIDSLKQCIDTEISYLTNFIKQNPQSLTSITALYQTFDNYSGRPLLLDVPDGIKYFNLVDSNLTTRYPNSQTVQRFHQATEALKMSEQKVPESNKKIFTPLLKIGDKAPHFIGKTIYGKEIRLEQFIGKIVILDFWASWNKTCINNNLFYKKMEMKYNVRGLEIIQVSIDINSNEAKSAIEKDNLPWKNQICDGKSWQNEIVKLYNVTQIPQNFLIDKNGKIFEINIYSEKMEKSIKRILGQ